MPPRNEEVAAAFRELADLLEITAGDRFRVLAYRRVADVVGGLGRDVAGLSEAELTTLRGVGRATAEKIREFAETGTMGHLLEMRAAVPSGVREMTRLPGLGPKKAMLICRELQISTIEELKDAIEARRLRGIPGLGAKTEENLLRAIAQHSASERRILLGMALSLAEEMLEALRQEKAVEEVSYAGSLRRMKETIGDLDLLAASHRPGEVREAFGRLPQVERVAASGPTKSSVITKGGLQVDLRVVAPDSYGAALQYFTGSKEHNVRLRELAVKQGLKVNEYGVFRVRT
ncbi:MAG: helix-hairpin-helix domain-containing protein, partial [Actinomycetota bacterium]